MTYRHMAIILLAFTSASAFCAAKAAPAAARSWPAKDFEQMKSQKMPILVYIVDEGYKNNPRAKLFEADILGSAEVKDQLKNFACVFIDSDGKRGKGWPKDFISRGSNGAAILMMSSDLRTTVWVDKSTPKEQLNGKVFQQGMQLVADYQAKINASAKKIEEEQKKKEVKEIAAKPPEEKGLSGILDGVANDPTKKKDTGAKKEEPKKKTSEPLDE